ncbi:S16 family serine protease [Chryseomicrobium sp. FSL W7-1435]|uniref:S16 family serine protease n=1 Tax=Chryseomicrobium sp. FSL W7-1435 TaxID=2921704 RepID=UPI00315AB3BE
MVLLAFEFQLLEFESYTFQVSQYADPVEVVEDSGIHLMVVSTFEVFYLTDEANLREQYSQEDIGVIELYAVTNAQRYFSKNQELARKLRLDTNEFDVMTRAVTTYLTDPSSSVRDFMDTTIITGNSMGLALVLSDLLSEEGVQNAFEIGVTGALGDNGAVSGIGMVNEKVLIAAESGFPYMLVPTENFEEAMATKEREDLAIEIHAVESVEEAVAYIESINQK